MRINVYAEELTGEVERVEKTASNTGITYYAARAFLASASELHHTPDDDDRTAITFWIPDSPAGKEALLDLLSNLRDVVYNAPLSARKQRAT